MRKPITVFEIRAGIDLLAEGRRREGRVQAFDRSAAEAAGAIAATRRGQGRVVEIRDVQIAGIAVSRHATLATRNVRHFEETGVELVNPWTD